MTGRLDPTLVKILVDEAGKLENIIYEETQIKWIVADKVNDMWSEHQGIFGNKDEYLAECSRVMNERTRIKMFGESGQTLRKWCQVQLAFSAFAESAELLSQTSFAHMEVAKSASIAGKVDSPVEAVAMAITNKWSADDLRFHFFNDPKSVQVDAKNILTKLLTSLPVKLNWTGEKAKNFRKELSELIERYL